MRVSNRARVVYLNPPRSASTTVDYLMQISYSDVWRPNDDAGHKTLWKNQWDNYFVFQTIRSPFTRAVSLWRRTVEALHHRTPYTLKYLDNGNVSFEDYLHCPSERIQNWWRWCCCSNFDAGVPHVNLLVHQEKLYEELAGVPGLKVSNNRYRPSSMQTPWYEHYNDRCVETVQKIFEPDFRRYNYTDDFEQAKAGNVFK